LKPGGHLRTALRRSLRAPAIASGQAIDRWRVVLISAIGAALVIAAEPARAAEEEATQIGGVDVVVWAPSARPADSVPVLVFSHALYMCPTQSRYLTSALADAGYLVVAPRHRDSSCSFSVSLSFERMSGKPSLLWSDSDYRDRADDIRDVVAALRVDARYRSIADPSQLGLIGHSLGGYTVLGLAGAWPSWRLPGVRAIVALTPYTLPFQRSEGLRQLSVPTMYQVGALDPVFTVPLEQFAYEQTSLPKFLVRIAWANHLAWTDFGWFNRDAIIGYTTAFLDHYVKGAPEGSALNTTLAGASDFRRD
jgi:predicted dienelactone hydrolase